MSIQPIPAYTPDLDYYNFSITLDKKVFILEFLYNHRSTAWTLNLQDANGNYVRTGIRVVSKSPLGARPPFTTLPEGRIIVMPIGEYQGDAKLGGFEFDTEMLYVDAESLRELTSG